MAYYPDRRVVILSAFVRIVQQHHHTDDSQYGSFYLMNTYHQYHRDLYFHRYNIHYTRHQILKNDVRCRLRTRMRRTLEKSILTLFDRILTIGDF